MTRKQIESGSENASPRNGITEAFVEGFFDYGLYTRGYQWAVDNSGIFTAETLLAASRRLTEAGLYPLAMRLMSVSLAEARRFPNPAEARILFPKAFQTLIEPRAEEEGIPAYLLYSLVREESFFDADSESKAGAVGLTQLMQVTATDMAELLDLAEVDRRDPETNLLLGSHHLGRLYRRLEDIPKTLAAYNAGLSRVRDWESRFADLPMDLFVEAIPFAETRHYIRKLLLSCVMYAWIYQDEDPAAVGHLFFPELPQAAHR
jgi:soluble lytic murein transglycosylase